MTALPPGDPATRAFPRHALATLAACTRTERPCVSATNRGHRNTPRV
jgi:hypothetical protein